MHEILTVQLGHSANYVATHFWNTQQSYFTYSEDAEPTPVDHDVHFRAGIGAGGVETYTPRTLIYDLKGGFGTMRKINALYDIDLTDKNRAEIWNNNVSVQKEPAIEVHPYITSLELGTDAPQLTTDSVRYWSDFNSLYYHPRSIVQLYQYEVNSALSPFENHTDGRELFTSIDKDYDILDRDIRYFAEECDQIQGIQFLASTDDGWGGFASEYALALRDEYPKTELWTWGIERGEKVPIEKRIPRTLGLANALSTLLPVTSIYVPLVSPPVNLPSNIQMDHESQWHKAALLSSAIETVTLQTRLKEKTFGPRLIDVSATLNTSGSQNISFVSMSLSDDDDDGDDDALVGGHPNERNMAVKSAGESRVVDLSWTGDEKHVFGTVKVSRGAMYNDLTPRRSVAGVVQGIPESTFQTRLDYPILDSFPKIFRGCKNSLSVTSSLRTSSSAMDKLRQIRDTVLHFAPRDVREDLYNDLSGFASAYEAGWDSGSDSGEDD